MSFEEDEKLIGQLLETYEVKKPSKDLMDGFEAEVFKKIESTPRFGMGVPAIAITVVLALALAGAFFLWPKAAVTPEKADSVIPASDVIPAQAGIQAAPELTPGVVSTKETTPEVETGLQETQMDEMARELFILQMLGEDEGLLDSFETDVELDFLGVDLEFMPQAQPPAAA